MSTGAQRNKSCTCGSGKKFKHCCIGRKPVNHTITVDMGEPMAISEVRVSGGKIEFFKDGKAVQPVRAWSGSYRESNKGEKSLHRIPIEPSSLLFGEIPALLQYDRLFAIDTSTDKIAEQNISVAPFMECKLTPDGKGYIFQALALGVFEFHGAGEKQENIAWRILIKAIQESPDYKPGDRYGIITDSDLGQHGSYNDRTNPYFAGHFLPENFSLVYAHDKGRSLVNQVLRMCDKTSKNMRKQFEAGKLSLDGASPVSTGVCTHFRAWLNNNGDASTNDWFKLKAIPADTFNTV